MVNLVFRDHELDNHTEHKAVFKKRQARPSKAFGTGNEDSKYETRNWTAPVHAVTADGDPITISFGKGIHEGEILVKRGHARTPKEFYGTKGQKHHDHFDKYGNSGRRGDRGKSD
jgi:hypothetical protein